MKTIITSRVFHLLTAFTIAGVTAGCGRTDTRVNSDPGPGRPSSADTGEPVRRAETNASGTSSGAASTAATTGTDSTGRPGDASGGTTGAGSGSGTSGTQTGPSSQPR